jgi:hypothetical protein
MSLQSQLTSLSFARRAGVCSGVLSCAVTFPSPGIHELVARHGKYNLHAFATSPRQCVKSVEPTIRKIPENSDKPIKSDPDLSNQLLNGTENKAHSTGWALGGWIGTERQRFRGLPRSAVRLRVPPAVQLRRCTAAGARHRPPPRVTVAAGGGMVTAGTADAPLTGDGYAAVARAGAGRRAGGRDGAPGFPPLGPAGARRARRRRRLDEWTLWQSCRPGPRHLPRFLALFPAGPAAGGGKAGSAAAALRRAVRRVFVPAFFGALGWHHAI